MHKCRAEGCRLQVATQFLMCGWHWRKVPLPIARAVSQCWRTGKLREWRKWATRAVYAVGIAEGKFRQVMDGVYHDLRDNCMHVEAPLLLDSFGWEDTEANRDRALEAARDAFRKLYPNTPQTVYTDPATDRGPGRGEE